MFTGIVEAMGEIVEVEARGDDRRLTIDAGTVCDDLSVGDSISVDGACLTAVEIRDATFRVDLIAPTLHRTIAGDYEVGTRVNLERALRFSDRLDGHLVQGHVDGVGRLEGVEAASETRTLEVRIPAEVGRGTVLHGSITINGVGLTVSELEGVDRCRIGIIPHTWEVTNLGLLEPGDRVNVEGDLIGKYVGRLLASRSGDG